MLRFYTPGSSKKFLLLLHVVIVPHFARTISTLAMKSFALGAILEVRAISRSLVVLP
jgi:hypothetical protein